MARQCFVVSLLAIVVAVGMARTAGAERLYVASLQNGDYGAGFKVGGPDGTAWNRSGSTGGDLNMLGIVDSAEGATFTTPYDVINYSLGADGKNLSSFRSHGTVSVLFKADLDTFDSGQPFVDNFGFNQFYNGQATFGTGMSRYVGDDGTAKTADDKISLGWDTWHNNVWYSHVNTAIRLDFDQWHSLGFTWGGATNDFEIWVDQELVAWDNLPSGVSTTWGRSDSAYNFALGAIHQRGISTCNSPEGVTFANIEIWDEYRDFGNTVPEPSGLVLLGLGSIAVLLIRRHRS